MMLIDERAKICAAWWAELLAAEPTTPSEDAGLVGKPAKVADTVVTRKRDAAARSGFTIREISTFQENLQEELTRLLSLRGSGCLFTRVDYHPDPVLVDAARAAGFNAEWVFPWKTTSFISETIVSVSIGYNGATRVLWRNSGDGWKWDLSSEEDLLIVESWSKDSVCIGCIEAFRRCGYYNPTGEEVGGTIGGVPFLIKALRVGDGGSGELSITVAGEEIATGTYPLEVAEAVLGHPLKRLCFECMERFYLSDGCECGADPW